MAASTNRIHDARLRTIGNALLLWGIPMWPPTPASWKALAATLKVGRYASAAVYFSTYRTAAERLGYVMDEFAIRSVKDYTRSCLRGLGAPARPRALPFESLIELPRSLDPWASNGPVNPRAAIVTGAWWLCREIELSCLRARLVEVSTSPRGVPMIAIHLPASKCDQLATGLSRSLCCLCTPAARAAGGYACPVCILMDHLRFLAISVSIEVAE